MSTLGIENLRGLGQAGGVEDLIQQGNTDALGRGKGIASEMRVTNEMRANGMDIPQAGGKEVEFSKLLSNSVETVNAYQVQADTAVKELVAGRSKNIHETMLTIERADTSLKLMMQVRNKILDAYREIMRMQV